MRSQKPHVVVMPLPSQGHINPLMKLAKLLHSKGFHVTFVHTEIIRRRILRSKGGAALEGTATFRFAAIPDGLHYETDDAGHDVAAVVGAFRNNLPVSFRELVRRINDGGGEEDEYDAVPRVSCIVSDGFMSFTLDVAMELGVPNVLVWPLSASSAMAFAHFGHLLQRGLVPLPDSNCTKNGYLDTTIEWIPCMGGIKLKDFPTMMRTTDPEDISFHFSKDNMGRAREASANVVNTFDAMEADIISELKLLFPRLFTIGPLHLLEKQLTVHHNDDDDDDVRCFGSNMYEEDSGCLEWLHTKEPESVILVNFGTTGFMTREQVIEFAWGLANSKHHFLWIIRPTIMFGDSAVLPPEFAAEVKGRGLISSWCDQEAVLSHPATGGFLTHCGWNSVLESICAGVPMIFCPTFADQPTNAWFCKTSLGVGLAVEDGGGGFDRRNIERLVRELMSGGERRREMKEMVAKWKKLAEEACCLSAPGGSSYKNFDQMVEVLLSK